MKNKNNAGQKEANKKVRNRLLKIFSPWKVFFLVAVFLNAFQNSITITINELLGRALDYILGNGGIEPHTTLWIIVLLSITNGASSMTATYLMGKTTNNIIFSFTSKTIKHIKRLPLAFLESHATGDFVSRINNDLANIQDFLKVQIIRTLKGALVSITIMVYFVIKNWILGISIIILMLVIMPIFDKSVKKLQSLHKDTMERKGDSTAKASDIFQGIRETKAFNAKERVINQFSELVINERDAAIKVNINEMKSSFIGRIASNMPGIIVFALGGWLVLNGKTTIGVVFSLNASMGYLRYNTYMSMQGFTVWKKTAASAVRIFDLWDKKTEDESWRNINKYISSNDPKDHSVFTFNNVLFSYSDNIDDKDEEKLEEKQKEAYVLKNISFSINKGETIAFVGRSGCGKTTLLKLMAGFYKAGCGRITKNGIDIRDLELDEIRNDMAMVSQEAFLFPVTIHNNILYGTGAGINESDGNNYIEPGDEVIHAVKLARIHSFIEAQPKKYESLVGERGIKLSGGQRQRLSIARAIIKNADILLLDEPTSALDTDAEHKVQTALNKLMENKTSIIAAHRLSGIKNADRIYVMDSGEIMEEGTHKELIEGKGLYYELYHRQMKETQVGIKEECADDT